MIPKDIEISAESAAHINGLAVSLVVGIILAESGGVWNPPVQYEKEFSALWDPNDGHPWKELTEEQHASDVPGDPDWDGMQACGTTPQEEWTGQKSSWGPMRLNGAVARSLGYAERFERLKGTEGIRYGVTHLRNLWWAYHESTGLDGVISAYDAGIPADSNQDYVLKVKDFIAQYEAWIGG